MIRKQGRPRISPVGRRVNFRIADDQWRALSRAASRAGMTPSAAIRASIRMALATDPDYVIIRLTSAR